MIKNWIDEIVYGLIDEVGGNNVYDIISHLGIKIIKDNEKQNSLLKKCDGIYLRNFFGSEIIIIKDNLENEQFVLAHELGHAMLHVNYDFFMNNPLSLNNKKEKEADYFATKLLYSSFQIEEGIETKEQLANYLMIEESCVDYIVN